jgi:hypothetical protein
VHCRLVVSSRPIVGGGWLHVFALPPGGADRGSLSPTAAAVAPTPSAAAASTGPDRSRLLPRS